MRTRELHDKAIEALFALADKGVVKIFYRGVSSYDIYATYLYEVQNLTGDILAEGTQREVLEWLGRDYIPAKGEGSGEDTNKC